MWRLQYILLLGNITRGCEFSQLSLPPAIHSKNILMISLMISPFLQINFNAACKNHKTKLGWIRNCNGAKLDITCFKNAGAGLGTNIRVHNLSHTVALKTGRIQVNHAFTFISGTCCNPFYPNKVDCEWSECFWNPWSRNADEKLTLLTNRIPSQRWLKINPVRNVFWTEMISFWQVYCSFTCSRENLFAEKAVYSCESNTIKGIHIISWWLWRIHLIITSNALFLCYI